MEEPPKMRLEDWLDDLCVRFVLNLPQEDLSSVARICFQVEEAQWFYEDFIRPLDPTLPAMSLRTFCLRIFQHCPLFRGFSVDNHMRAFEQFMQYKIRVPVRGAIMLNDTMDSAVLVKGWKKGANWSFPRGKINMDEDDLDCAIREVYEETGFDLNKAGLVPEDRNVKYFEQTIREQQLRLYVFRDVPMSTLFEPKTRKEISKIQWYKLSDLPAYRNRKGNHHESGGTTAAKANQFYMVASFLPPLKKWVKQQLKKDAPQPSHGSHLSVQALHEEPGTEEEAEEVKDTIVVEPPTATPAIETLEEANRELKKLLQIHGPTQGLQPEATVQTQDKGGALLAMLQAKNAPPAPPAVPQASTNSAPHTPLDLLYNVAPVPHNPRHQHHPAQRLPQFGYHAPPSFPYAPNANQNLPPRYENQAQAQFAHMIPQGQAAANLQPYLTAAPPPQGPPALVHPQPLPPQANQLLAGAALPTPPFPDHGMPRQANVAGQAGPAVDLLQQYYPKVARPPAVLDETRLALLNAFKQDGGPKKEPAHRVPAQPAPAPAPASHQQQQGINWAPLATTYGMQPTANPSGQSGAQPFNSPGMAAPRLAAAQAALRPPPVAGAQQKALLDMFKQAAAPSPPQENTRLDGAAPGPPSLQHRSSGPASAASAETVRAGARANDGSFQANTRLPVPFAPLAILTRPKNAEGQAPLQPLASQPTVAASTMARAASSEVQQARLMSLFTATPQATLVVDEKGKGKALPVHSQVALLPVPPVGGGGGGVGGVSGGGSAPAAARRDNQAPISPENEQFLLNYLKSVSNSAPAPH